MVTVGNDGSCIIGDFVAESELGPTSIAIKSGGAALADGAIRIDLMGLDEEWFIRNKVSKIKINDAIFVLEER